MKTLVKKIQGLRHLGIEDQGIELPKICVVGDQSTGKSSLIEGMSEIKVPRSAGTCTRCPMEINLTESAADQPWKCDVFLTKTHIYDPLKKFKNVLKRLGPWADIGQSPENEHFMKVTDKNQLQEVLKYAQLAILNPHLPPSDFAGKNSIDESHYLEKFSPNAVRLDISAPGFPTLSFYDLPGVISQAEIDDERFLVGLVTKLVKDYISHDNCIVLLAQTMTNDATNSKAAATIAEVKGAKSRTLGVLTKPDRVQTGESYVQWREILEGRKFPLRHGYYVVKNNPNPSVEHWVARREENEFFSSSPWDDELSGYSDRLGTRNLQNALSSLLLGQIQDCLPRIINQIDEKAASIDAELSTLPDLPSENITYLVARKLYLLEQSIKSQIEGGSSEYPMHKLWNHIAADFKLALNWIRPTIEILMDGEEAAYRAGMADDNSNSDIEVVSVQPAKSARRSPGDGLGSRVTPVPAETKPDTVRRPKYSTHHFEDFTRAKKRFTLETIRAINEDYYRAGHPGQIDPRALEVMNQSSVLHWVEPMEVFVEATHKLLKRTLMESLDTVFCEYRQTSLYRELKKIMDEYLVEIFHEHLDSALENYQVEYHKPFTIATTSLQVAIDKHHEALKQQRHRFRANAYLNAQGKLPSDPKREAEIKKLTHAELGVDQYTREVEMMAVRMRLFT